MATIPEMEQFEVNGETYDLLDQKLRSAILRGEVFSTLVVAENGEALVTENGVELDAHTVLSNAPASFSAFQAGVRALTGEFVAAKVQGRTLKLVSLYG